MADEVQWGLATPRPIDFSWLGNLPDVYRQAQQESQQQAVQNAFARGFPKDANGNPDFTKMQNTLLGLPGGFQAAAQVAALQRASEPDFQMSTDAFGNQQPIFIDKGKQTVTPGTIQPTASQSGQPGSSAGQSQTSFGTPNPGQQLTGEDFLAAAPIPDGMKAQIRAIARGDQPLPPRGTKAGIALGNLVNQYDPTYSASTAPTRMATRKAFAVGKQGDAATALNTLPGHLAMLSSDVDSLGGVDTGIGAIDRNANALRNWWNRGGSSDAGKAMAKTDTDMVAVDDELERVWRGTGGNLGDILAWRQQFDNASTPSNKHAALSRVAGLVLTRADALKDQYSRGMGTDQYAANIGGKSVDPSEIVRPEDETILQTLAKGQQLPPELSGPGESIPPSITSPRAGLIRSAPPMQGGALTAPSVPGATQMAVDPSGGADPRGPYIKPAGQLPSPPPNINQRELNAVKWARAQLANGMPKQQVYAALAKSGIDVNKELGSQ